MLDIIFCAGSCLFCKKIFCHKHHRHTALHESVHCFCALVSDFDGNILFHRYCTGSVDMNLLCFLRKRNNTLALGNRMYA